MLFLDGGRGEYVADIQRKLDEFLAVVESRDVRGAIFLLPPRCGKTSIFSHALPANYLTQYPEKQAGVFTYRQDIADDIERAVRQHIPTGARFHACSRGAAIAGRGFDLIVMDDLIKDKVEAHSPTLQKQLRDWFLSSLRCRAMPGGAIVYAGSRWCEGDFAGWLIEEFPEWPVYRYPMRAENGALLCPERFTAKQVADLERHLKDDFAALFQQEPVRMVG